MHEVTNYTQEIEKEYVAALMSKCTKGTPLFYIANSIMDVSQTISDFQTTETMLYVAHEFVVTPNMILKKYIRKDHIQV
jgi:hypothetical protein